MQLPRGTFREIKKKTKFGGFLEELQQTRFTGICTISFGTANGIIVFKSGKRILAEFQGIAGDAAWEELQKIVEETVGASLSTLDEAQIQLSLEFNKPFRIGKADQFPHSNFPSTQSKPVKKSPPAHPKSADDLLIKNHQKPVTPQRASLNQSLPNESLHTQEPSKKTLTSHPNTTAHNPSAVISLQSQVYTQRPDENEILTDEASHEKDMNSLNFDKDIDIFETMDVEAITNKIRGECKTIIKQLQLEHLTDR